MPHRIITEQIREQTALYALGVLPPQQARALEEHLGKGCAVCVSELRAFQETATRLPLALAEKKPHSRVREKLLARIQSPTTPQAGVQAEKTPSCCSSPMAPLCSRGRGHMGTNGSGRCPVQTALCGPDPTDDDHAGSYGARLRLPGASPRGGRAVPCGRGRPALRRPGLPRRRLPVRCRPKHSSSKPHRSRLPVSDRRLPARRSTRLKFFPIRSGCTSVVPKEDT